MPLPVLTRGRPNAATGRDEGVMVQPSLLPPFPRCSRRSPPNQQTALRMGELLSCAGHHLAGDQVQVLFPTRPDGAVARAAGLPGATEGISSTKSHRTRRPAHLDPDSPLNPDNWQAGVYGVSARIQRAGKPDRLTNELPVALAPRVAVAAAVAGDDLTFTATVSPKVWKTQQASLVIAERELAAEPIAVDKTATLTFKAKTGDLPSGPQWVRLRVDGIESLLVDRSGSLPRFDPTQQVTI